MWRQRNTKPTSKVLHIGDILRRRKITFRVAQHLRLGREAANWHATDRAFTHEPSGRINPVDSVLHALNAVAGLVEGYGMDVDFESRQIF